MSLEFYIVGGKMHVPPEVLALEMLKKESVLRSFVSASKSGLEKRPKLIKNDDGNSVTLDFTGAEVLIAGTPTEVLGPLKAQYRQQITGNLSCLVKYEMMIGSHFIRFDFEEE